MEDIVAPHLIKMYLEGNSDVLKVRSGQRTHHSAPMAAARAQDSEEGAEMAMQSH